MNELKNAWQHYKQSYDLPPLEADEIRQMLPIIASEHPVQKQHMFFLHIAMFLLLILCCQGG
ncbi:MAG: hypothetical protein AAGI49_03965 [Bacteroidota bacterium]